MCYNIAPLREAKSKKTEEDNRNRGHEQDLVYLASIDMLSEAGALIIAAPINFVDDAEGTARILAGLASGQGVLVLLNF
jgi:hypothetical protein